MLTDEERVSEVVWDDLVHDQCAASSSSSSSYSLPCATGSGCSVYVAKPPWQYDHGCTGRSESDISADADPNTGVYIFYDGYYYPATGGTSVASPMIAAMFALSGNASTASAATLWAAGGSSAFNPIVSGTNENRRAGTFICPRRFLYICKAGTYKNGLYSGPTGWGSPNGLGAL